MKRKKVLIMGASGKDFHVFNAAFKTRPEYEVVCFTTSQLPGLDGRTYPARMAGPMYPDGIPIEPEEDLRGLIRQYRVDEALFCYSDVSYETVLEKEQLVQDAGAEFRLAPDDQVIIPSTKHVIAVSGTRTGVGKAAVVEAVGKMMRRKGRRVAVVAHPMPYGDLSRQEYQKFEGAEDLERHECSIEEREVYEPLLKAGFLVFAGVDYCRIIQEAEDEADCLIWYGGNNDIPFFRPDIHICVADPLRAGHERDYYPGRNNFADADIILINKVDSATKEMVDEVVASAKELNPNGRIVQASMPYAVDKPELIQGQKVLVIEDSPTTTHGEMKFGAGFLAAKQLGAAEIVDPRAYAKGAIADLFEAYPDCDSVLPALGYTEQQRKDLEKTIAAVPCDAVVIGSACELANVISISQPVAQVTYGIAEDTEEGKPSPLMRALQDY